MIRTLTLTLVHSHAGSDSEYDTDSHTDSDSDSHTDSDSNSSPHDMLVLISTPIFQPQPSNRLVRSILNAEISLELSSQKKILLDRSGFELCNE